ncbi:protein EPIDERMAL PATTERNING FACTOR 1-like [Rosa sericea]|uniref:protein EPIDERMAL PATTERNING FACTOR 1-like n=1 Tax=Rosa rugosa TaxID=74645 RepID=UPI002B412ADB|nr:protein EPIDERMAL PATTERNING FACTOR 1-like [Rosa rugosa]
MKGCNVTVIAVLLVLLLVPAAMSARHIARPHSRHVRNLRSSSAVPTSTTMTATKDHRSTHVAAGKFLRKGPDTLQVAGSSLPDCSHACGSCTPCRLVMVSFVCASIEEAETCPMAYKCMCNNKSYPVP